jgi:hypothetical protein
MNVPTEFAKALAEFPLALRELVLAELAAGNSIAEISGGFPAPPSGNCLRLAKKVSTRPRASVAGIDFYHRNSSIYSGEFTDAKRFFFILEPPEPPPPEPDMDAIRKMHDPKPNTLVQLSQRKSGSIARPVLGESYNSPNANEQRAERSAALGSLTATESATGWARILHFQDKRPPHEVQFALERELRILFAGALDGGKLCLVAQANVNGARYCFELRFAAALFFTNCYSLRVEVSWAEHATMHHEYFRKSSDSWWGLWIRDLMPANPADAVAGSPERYRELAEASLKAEENLDSVAAIQQAIIVRIKCGGSFGTSHKEGGTNIFWRNGEFVRADYGDYPDLKTYADEADFLNMLWQFCQWDVTRNADKERLCEIDTWKLILRRLHSQ